MKKPEDKSSPPFADPKTGNAKDGEKFMVTHLWRKREQFRSDAQKG
jgi:hypothetical protein